MSRDLQLNCVKLDNGNNGMFIANTQHQLHDDAYILR